MSFARGWFRPFVEGAKRRFVARPTVAASNETICRASSQLRRVALS